MQHGSIGYFNQLIDCVYFATRDRYFEVDCLNTHIDYLTDFLRIRIDAEISHIPDVTPA
jgi:hypothetical protein